MDLKSMTDGALLIISIFTLGYLFYSLIHPEEF